MDYFSSILPSSLSAKLLGTLLSLGSLLLGLLIYWRRTDSLHAVWERVWRVVAGSTEVQDPRLRSFMQEMRDLEKFRLIYGLKITNMADMQRLIRWVRRHRLDMSALQKARRWVDIANPDIISPPTNGYLCAIPEEKKPPQSLFRPHDTHSSAYSFFQSEMDFT